jgi:large subunit ribosomal protein L34
MHCENDAAAASLTSDVIHGKITINMPKRTFQPKKRTRAKVVGFMKRMSTNGGRAILKRRRNKGRKSLSA